MGPQGVTPVQASHCEFSDIHQALPDAGLRVGATLHGHSSLPPDSHSCHPAFVSCIL